MKRTIFPLITLLILSSCSNNERVSSEVFEEVNSSMEVKRLTEAEILQEAMIWGDSISSEAQTQLISNLKKAIEEKGVDGAIDFCNVSATPILKEVGDKYGIEIRRASTKYRNPQDRPTEEEAPILDAYEYNAENGLESDPNIQKFDQGETYLYTKAIVIPGAFCLSCHGDPKTEIGAKTLEAIQANYPLDKATGHKVGDLRGMWSLRIPKSEVVKRM